MLRACAVIVLLLFVAGALWAGPVISSKAKAKPTQIKPEPVPVEEFSPPAPSILGPTGVILTPNAQTVGDCRWNVGYHFWQSKDGSTDINTVKANVGLGPNAEVGAAYFNYDYPSAYTYPYYPYNSYDDSETIWSFKYRFWNETETDPGVAAGVIDVGDQIDLTAYLLVSKTFMRHSSLPISLTVGWGSGSSEMHHFFGSGVFHVLPTLDVLTELDHRDFNYGLRWWPWKNVNVDVGALSTKKAQVYGGIAYTGHF